MRFEAIWDQLKKKDARLANDGAVVEIKSSNLRQLLRQVYEQGERSAKVESAPSPLDQFFKGGRSAF